MFLGVIFDNKRILRQKCEKAMTSLKVVAKIDWGADRSLLMGLYCSSVWSRLQYGSAGFSSACKSCLKKSEAIQNQGLRIC